MKFNVKVYHTRRLGGLVLPDFGRPIQDDSDVDGDSLEDYLQDIGHDAAGDGNEFTVLIFLEKY